jgi:hypothetical protein
LAKLLHMRIKTKARTEHRAADSSASKKFKLCNTEVNQGGSHKFRDHRLEYTANIREQYYTYIQLGLLRLCRAPRLLDNRSHRPYFNLAVRRDYSSLGCVGSTSTTLCTISTTCLAATPALRQPHCAPQVLITRPHGLYINCAARPGASASHVARRRLLR